MDERVRPASGGGSLAAAAAIAGALALAPAPARAEPVAPQIADDYGFDETARSAALGGALAALGNGTTGLLLNPAAMALTRVYHLEALAQITPEAGPRQAYGGVVVDSITGRLAGGLSVIGGFMRPPELDRSRFDVRVGLAYPLSDRVFVGLGGRYSKVSQSFTARSPLTPFGPDDKVAGGLSDGSGGRYALVNTFTFDAGLVVKPTDTLHLGFVGKNLTYPNNSLLPTLLGGGIGYGSQDLSIEADALADMGSWSKTSARIMLGGEYLVADHFPIRLGYRFDAGGKVHALSGGLGYIAREFSIEASVRRTLGADANATTIVIGLAYFLESSGLTRAPNDLE